VWSAIHLNMPARNEAPWDFICATSALKKIRIKWPWCHFSWPGQGLRKTAWALLGFFAPELVRRKFRSSVIPPGFSAFITIVLTGKGRLHRKPAVFGHEVSHRSPQEEAVP